MTDLFGSLLTAGIYPEIQDFEISPIKNFIYNLRACSYYFSMLFEFTRKSLQTLYTQVNEGYLAREGYDDSL